MSSLVTPYPPERDGIADYSSLLVAELRRLDHVCAVLVPTALDEAPPEVNGFVGRTPRSVRDAARAVCRFAPDVVHVQFCVAAFGPSALGLLALLRRLRRSEIPIIVTLHDVTRDTAALRRAGKAFYRTLCTLAEVVIVHTDTAAELVSAGIGCRRRSGRPASGADASAVREVRGGDLGAASARRPHDSARIRIHPRRQGAR